MEKAIKTNYWLLAFILIYTTFNGALRKWVLESAITDFFTFLVQIGMLFAVLLAYRRDLTGDVRIIVGVYGIILALFALNPRNATLFHGGIGFILHFGIWLTCFVYYQNRDVFPYEKIVRLAIIVLLIQFADIMEVINKTVNRFVVNCTKRVFNFTS